MYVIASVPMYGTHPTGNALVYVYVYTTGDGVHIIDSSNNSVLLSLKTDQALTVARSILEAIYPEEYNKLNAVEDQFVVLENNASDLENLMNIINKELEPDNK